MAAYDLVSGRRGTIQGTGVSSENGPGYRRALFTGTSSFIYFSNPGNVSTEPLFYDFGPQTIALIHSPSSTSQAALWCYSNSESGLASSTIVWSFGGDGRYSFWNDNNNNSVSPTSTFGTGVANYIVGRRLGNADAVSQHDVFINGVLAATGHPVRHGDADNAGTNPHYRTINGFGGFDGYHGSGSIAAILQWSRALSDKEVSLLGEDPWGPFRQTRTEYIFLDVIVAGGNWSGTVGTGAAPLTGQTPLLNISHTYAPGTASVLFTGQSSQAVSTGVGATPNTSALTLAGQSLSLSATVSATPGTAALSVVGQSVQFTNGLFLMPATAGFSLSGIASSVLAHSQVIPSNAAMVIAGQPLTMGLTEFAPGTGTVILTGQSLALSTSNFLTPGTGDMTPRPVRGGSSDTDAMPLHYIVGKDTLPPTPRELNFWFGGGAGITFSG